ncbi:hypothetical protein Hanom_Chr10g00921111 [Helianthus anomalus]
MSEDEEEGENRHHECTNPVSDGPVEFPADGSPTPERLSSPEGGRFRNEKSAEGSETFSHGKHNNDVGTENMAAEKVGGDSQLLEERKTDHENHNPVSELPLNMVWARGPEPLEAHILLGLCKAHLLGTVCKAIDLMKNPLT